MNKDLIFLITNICIYNYIFCHGEDKEISKIIENNHNAIDYQFLFKVVPDEFNINKVTIIRSGTAHKSDLL